MRPAAKRRVKNLALAYVYSLAGTVVFMLFVRKDQRHMDLGDWLVTFFVPLLLTAMQGLVQQEVVPRTRRFVFSVAVVIRGLAYCISIAGSIALVVWTVNLYMNGWVAGNEMFAHRVHDQELSQGLVYGCVIIFAYTFLTAISQKLGPGVMLNWILGRYHHPKKEERIFMFLDLRDSTGIAAKLGPEKYSRFVQEFFRDMTVPLLDNDAEVSHFIGDEVVLSWSMRRGLEDAKCIRCFFAVKEEISSLAPYYQKTYDLVPTFKAGAHCGHVVAADVGEIKSEIVFHGDVLNVASRIQSLCGEEGADFLISGDLASLLPAQTEFDLVPLGDRLLRGKLDPIQIFRCSLSGPGTQPKRGNEP